jgi:multisubunit Na+/H+ antiporter MnhE subunit
VANASGEEQRGPLGGGGRRGAALAFAGSAVVSGALWLALVDTTHFQELVAGAVVALIGAATAVLVRSQRRLVLRPRARWFLAAWRPFAAYPRDLALVTMGLIRRREGRLFTIPFDAREENPREAARRVLMKTAGSFAPNTYVVGGDEERGLLLVHQLVPTPDPAADVDPMRLR